MKSRSLHGPLLRHVSGAGGARTPAPTLETAGGNRSKEVPALHRVRRAGRSLRRWSTNSSMHPSTRQSTISTCTSRPSRTALAFTSVRSASGDPASPADNSPQIVCVYVQFEHQRALAYHFVHVHGIRVLHQMPRHVLQQISHGTLPFPSLRRLELLPHARLAQQISGRVGRLSASSQPLQGLLLVHGDLRGIGDGVVVAQLVDKPPVAGQRGSRPPPVGRRVAFWRPSASAECEPPCLHLRFVLDSRSKLSSETIGRACLWPCGRLCRPDV